MFEYILTIATAATLVITPGPAIARSDVDVPKKVFETSSAPLRITSGINISDPLAPYILSDVEQKAFSRALLRSVKILARGTRPDIV